MKPSLYNSIIKIGDDTTLIYNALSDSFVVVKGDSVCAHIENNSLNSLSEQNALLYEQLKETGAIVEDEMDEIAYLRHRIETIDNDPSFFILQVNPTLDCNFNP